MVGAADADGALVPVAGALVDAAGALVAIGLDDGDGTGEPAFVAAGDAAADADFAEAAGDVDGAGVPAEGCGNAYTAKTAGRLATSFNVRAVPAKRMRCGGKVGPAAGAIAPPAALGATDPPGPVTGVFAPRPGGAPP